MATDFQQQVKEWAGTRGLLDSSTPEDQITKLGEEFGELCTAIAKGDDRKTIDAIGDMQVVLAVICAMWNWNVDTCREAALQEIQGRKGRVVDGIFVKEAADG